MRWTELTLSPSRLRHQGSGPVGRLTRRVAKRQGDHALRRLGAQRLDSRGTRLVAQQSIEPLLDKAFLPAPNAGLGLGRSPHNLVRADAIGGQQHDFSPPDVLLRRVAVLHHSFEPANIGERNGEGFSCAQRAHSYVEPASGIPARTQMLGSIH